MWPQPWVTTTPGKRLPVYAIWNSQAKAAEARHERWGVLGVIHNGVPYPEKHL